MTPEDKRDYDRYGYNSWTYHGEEDGLPYLQWELRFLHGRPLTVGEADHAIVVLTGIIKRWIRTEP